MNSIKHVTSAALNQKSKRFQRFCTDDRFRLDQLQNSGVLHKKQRKRNHPHEFICQSKQEACSQYVLHGYQFCIRHIFEDPCAPYKQCEFIEEQSQMRCCFPVSTSIHTSRVCKWHEDYNGNLPLGEHSLLVLAATAAHHVEIERPSNIFSIDNGPMLLSKEKEYSAVFEEGNVPIYQHGVYTTLSETTSSQRGSDSNSSSGCTGHVPGRRKRHSSKNIMPEKHGGRSRQYVDLLGQSNELSSGNPQGSVETKRKSRGSADYRGVYCNGRKFRKLRNKYLGTFITAEDAALAHDRMSFKQFGESAQLTFLLLAEEATNQDVRPKEDQLQGPACSAPAKPDDQGWPLKETGLIQQAD